MFIGSSLKITSTVGCRAAAFRVCNRFLHGWQRGGERHSGSVQDGDGQPASDARQVALRVQLARLQSCLDGSLSHPQATG